MTHEEPRLDISAKVVGRVKIREDRQLQFNDASVVGGDFSGRKLDYFGASNSRFDSCRFDWLTIREYCASFGSGRKQTIYRDCSFDGARITCMGGGYYRFERCSFREVDLREWFCFEVDIVDCVFTGKLRKAVFNGRPEPSGVKSTRNEIHGNDFSAADLIDVDFRTGVDLSKQRLPTGPEYLYIPEAKTTFNRARAEAITWTNLEVRQPVLRWIDSGLRDVELGQKQKLFRPKDHYGFGGMKRDELDAYFGLLRRYAEHT